ncbi:hypothetical protein J7337_001939 [Fusarium musae]|uniref:UPF0506 domain-containing protein n=1 Tax=Fusarium musae TaxID=1042133 RepID=A0A9P8DN75_9HYPO|nr:hypothetical protein J7337_001939 [Fusarium musae]KAG9504973.1 hypothetical protein J7337_001939 [Fusarium musae]
MKFPVLSTLAMIVAIAYAQDFDDEFGGPIVYGGGQCDDFGKRCGSTLDCCGIYVCRAVDDKPFKICKVDECRALGKGCQVDSECCSGVCTWVDPKNLNSGARECKKDRACRTEGDICDNGKYACCKGLTCTGDLDKTRRCY